MRKTRRMKEVNRRSGWEEGEREEGEKTNMGYRRGGTKKNLVDQYGRVKRCIVCRSKYHFDYNCLQRCKGKDMKRVEEKVERVDRSINLGENLTGLNEGEYEGIWAIVDTGCGKAVIGER